MELDVIDAPVGTVVVVETADSYLGIKCPCDGHDPDGDDEVTFNIRDDDRGEAFCPRCSTRYSWEIEHRWVVYRDGDWIANT